jgi:pimeloyl-ACP methyl ester carboxylesterase
MMHGMTRFAARLFGGGFGVPLHIPVKPREVTCKLRIGDYPALIWDGPGDGPPVVLLHGLQNGAWIWARVGTLLEENFKVVAPNLRGHGVDNAPVSGYSLETTTHDLLEIFDQLGVDKCHLVGHSWGGKVATHFTASHPQRVASLCLADPVPPRGLNSILQLFPGLISAAFAPERVAYGNYQELQQGSRQLVYLQNGDDVDRRVWEEKYRQAPDKAYIPRLPQSAFDELVGKTFAEDISALARTIACPVMLLKPLFTVSFLPGETAGLRRVVGGAGLKRIAGDHSFIHSNAIDTAAAVQQFLHTL